MSPAERKLVRCKIDSLVTSSWKWHPITCVIYIFFLTSESRGPIYIDMKCVTQRCEYQEVEIIGNCRDHCQKLPSTSISSHVWGHGADTPQKIPKHFLAPITSHLGTSISVLEMFSFAGGHMSVDRFLPFTNALSNLIWKVSWAILYNFKHFPSKNVLLLIRLI